MNGGRIESIKSVELFLVGSMILEGGGKNVKTKVI